MIEIHGLSKSFGRLRVLRELDLEVSEGEVTAVLGPNGAGKTTLIKCILGLVRPDGGRIRVGDHLLDGSSGYRRDVGYMPQLARYPDNLTGREIIGMIRELRNGQRAEEDLELVEAFGMEAELDKPFRNLSGGNRQRLSAVVAFLFRPRVLFLDEPTAGLDPISSSRLKDKILREAREPHRTVVLTSHVLAEVQELAERVVYLLDGRIRFDAPVAELMDEAGAATLERAVAWKLEESDRPGFVTTPGRGAGRAGTDEAETPGEDGPPGSGRAGARTAEAPR